MAVAEDSIDIRAPIDAVFSAITDPRRTMEWNSSIAGVGDINGYPPRLGSTWTQLAMIAGRKVNLNCRIVDWRPPFEGVLQVSGGQNATITTACRAIGDLTRVSQRIDFDPPGGPLSSIVGGVATRAIRGEMSKALQRQKDTIEREARERK